MLLYKIKYYSLVEFAPFKSPVCLATPELQLNKIYRP